jgi:hypothetical protein
MQKDQDLAKIKFFSELVIRVVEGRQMEWTIKELV